MLCGPGLDALALQRWLADSARGGAVVSVLDAAACLATLDPSSALGLEVAAARAVRAKSCEPANTSQAALGSKCGPRAGVYCCPLCLPCLLCIHTSLLFIKVTHLDSRLLMDARWHLAQPVLPLSSHKCCLPAATIQGNACFNGWKRLQ